MARSICPVRTKDPKYDDKYYFQISTNLITALELQKDDVDKVIEDEITLKLGEDLIQSIERKFQVDLERAVDMALTKIRMLLQNGTTVVQDRLTELQGLLESLKEEDEQKVEACLFEKQNNTTILAEKALHQMVVCGYALIGHDPGQAVRNVLNIKNMISDGVKPMYAQKDEVYKLLKSCGHEHDSLKKVVKCVISKSPLIKSVMMDVTGKLIEGVVGLTKLMAHGAMHEACLIEVIKAIEDEAFDIVKEVKQCAYGNNTQTIKNVNKVQENNATIVDNKNEEDKKEEDDMKDLVKKMIHDKNINLDKNLKNKLTNFQNEVGAVNSNVIPSNDDQKTK